MSDKFRTIASIICFAIVIVSTSKDLSAHWGQFIVAVVFLLIVLVSALKD